jgi:two-component system OmpR family response regulator
MERSPAHILLVDDDPGIRSLVSAYLTREGYDVESAEDGPAMDRAMTGANRTGNPFDLIVLDLMLPGESGQQIIRRMSPDADAPAVIVLSAMGEARDRIEGLELGADDYVAKPCNPRELLARIRAVLRRRMSVKEARAGLGMQVGFAGWKLDLVRRELRSPSGILINLSDGEFLMLNHLVSRAGDVLSRETLLGLSGQSDSGDRSVDVQISRLRRKLSTEGSDGADLIRTVRNGGYMFTATVTPV